VKEAEIHSKLLIPKNIKEPLPVLLMFHGLSGSSDPWTEKIVWAASGFIVAALDCRGQGGDSVDPGGMRGNTLRGHIIRGVEIDGDATNALMRNIFLDSVQLIRILMDMPETDSNRFYAMGGSQGGGLSVACAALAPAIKKIAIWHPYLSDYKRVCQLNTSGYAYEDLKMYLRLFDPMHRRADEFFNILGYWDVHHHAKRLKCDVLMGITLADEICPPSTQFAVYNNIRSKKQNYIFPDYGHENVPQLHDIVYTFLTEGL
jgi:cephalosporin-C deacetylase